MKFEISDIIESRELKIKLLTYEFDQDTELNLNILSQTDLERFHAFGCKKRRGEFFFTRFLWQTFEEYQPIVYDENGKPELEEGFISISHSKNAIAIAFSKTHPIGLDIEHYNPKIWRIRNKFLSEFEQDSFDLNEEKTITTLWSIKEAVYKLMGIPGLSFKNAIKITEIGDLNRVIVTNNGAKLDLTFQRLIFDTFILTYCSGNSANSELK